jgi:hypothetical protein
VIANGHLELRYVVAAGAIGSPALLLRSALDGPLVGRYYMRHLCPIAIGLFPQRTGADETYVKQVGFADYYWDLFNLSPCRAR